MGFDLSREVSAVYREHASSLLRYAQAIARDPDEARDAVQEAFLRLCMERRYGREVENPRAWLYQVLRNHLMTKRSSAPERREVASDALDSFPCERTDPESLAARQQRAKEIRAQLTPRELECLQLRAAGLSYAEIGGRLDIQSGTVGALLFRVGEKLRWPPGREGTIGLGNAEAIHCLLSGAQRCLIPSSNR
jgi:RNA polymerase sigma-70 factor (ECF subfamily)